MKNIALLAPNGNSFSETFIRAHRDLLDGKVFFYYSGNLPSELKGSGPIGNSRINRILHIIKGYFRSNKFTLEELALLRSFKREKINIVFAEYGETGEKILNVCEYLKIPLIVHFHGYDASVFSTIKRNNNYQRIIKSAEFLVVVSKKMNQTLLDLGCPQNKLIYNPYGPRDVFFQVNPHFQNQQFIALGRFVNKKAPYYLILSFLKVVEKYPEAVLVIGGEGELLTTCKNLVKFYDIESKIKFPGIISPQRFQEYLMESVAFVQHSITAADGNSEGTPVSILEASAAGLPIISTFHAGIPDVVIDGKTGLLVQEHDVTGMAEKMIMILENDELAKDLGKNGKKNIKENFTLGRHMNVLNELVDRVLATN